MERDPLHPFGLIVHLACLVVLEKKNGELPGFAYLLVVCYIEACVQI